jgi:broad specificity phosphatase PhoE
MILVRHGATEWSLNGRHTGRTDLPLLLLGREQAQAAQPVVRAELGLEPFRLWSSPLRRASETASILFGDLECTFDDRLVEFDYGNFEGLTSDQITAKTPGWTVWDGCPGGETVSDVVDRVDSFLAGLQADPVETHVIVAHSHLLRTFGARAICQPGEFGRHLAIDTGAVCVIDDYKGARRILRWNTTAVQRP